MNGDRALVIGVDGYRKTPSAALQGAVRDALAFADWLMDPRGGRLGRGDITLLLSPSEKGAQPRPEQVDGPASLDSLVEALGRLSDEEAAGGRLYFYFAGHGCRTDSLNAVLAKDALLFEELNYNNPASAAVGVADLSNRLRMLPFRQVVLIADACRNFPYATAFQLNGLGLDTGGTGGDFADEYRLMATAVGEVAKGDGSPEDVRGVFSRALTEALAGRGTAKSYDDDAGQYQVSWRSLCDHLMHAVPGQRPDAAGGADLLLAAFPDGWFADVSVAITIDPGPAEPVTFEQASVVITFPRISGDSDGRIERSAPFPTQARVPPRRVRVEARAGTYVARRTIPAYAPINDIQLTLGPVQPPVYQPTDTDVVLRGPGSGPCYLDVVSADHADVLQVLKGRTLVGAFIGEGKVALQPGGYTIRVPRGPRWGVAEELVDVMHPNTLTRVEVPERSGRLTSEPASSLAWASSPAQLAAELAAVGGGGGPLVCYRNSLGVVVEELDSDAAAHHRLEWGETATIWVPVLDGVATVIVADEQGLAVGLYDRSSLGDPHALALVDRAQELTAVVESEVITLIAEQPAVSGSRVLALLMRQADEPRLLSGAAPQLAHRLLDTTPWAVYAGSDSLE